MFLKPRNPVLLLFGCCPAWATPGMG